MSVWENEQADVLALDGAWKFALGEQTGTIQVPGCWEAAGLRAPGRRSGDVPARRGHPGGMGRAARAAPIRRGELLAEVSVNGTPVGTHHGTWTAFALDVTGRDPTRRG